jgi:hypothetical protein
VQFFIQNNKKIIVSRLRIFLPKIISANQGGFMEKRKIKDNIIITQETIHTSKTKGDKGMIV